MKKLIWEILDIVVHKVRFHLLFVLVKVKQNVMLLVIAIGLLNQQYIALAFQEILVQSTVIMVTHPVKVCRVHMGLWKNVSRIYQHQQLHRLQHQQRLQHQLEYAAVHQIDHSVRGYQGNRHVYHHQCL